jgi:sec-independent protein translocase protein TatA
MNFITVLLLFNFGGGEIFLILVAAIMLFGSKRIPEIARGLGKGIREVRNATNDIKREIQKGINEAETQVEQATQEVEKPAEEVNQIVGAVTRKRTQPESSVSEENIVDDKPSTTINQDPQ